MKIRIITYFLLLLSLSVTAQTKRAIVIGLGEQQDKAWNKINGDKDVPFVQAMLKNAGFKSVTTLVNQQAKIINTKAKPLAERWITISACRSDQVNVEMKKPTVGKLTYALWKELKNIDKVGNDEFMRRIRKFVNRNTCSRPQQPEMTGEDINKYNITDILSR